MEEARRINWRWPPNAGRHWFRSVLAGKVSPDVLAAQMGHIHGAVMPWWGDSGFDPLAIQRDLGRPLERQLDELGFEVWRRRPTRRSLGLKKWLPERRDGPAQLRVTPYVGLGGLLVSAIWNGALLNPALWDEVAWRLSLLIKRKGLRPHWIELRVHPRFGQQRWYLDEGTCRLLRLCDPVTLAEDGIAADALLERWFGTQEKAQDFYARALARWRVRLPPNLFAIAIGDSEIHVISEANKLLGGTLLRNIKTINNVGKCEYTKQFSYMRVCLRNAMQRGKLNTKRKGRINIRRDVAEYCDVSLAYLWKSGQYPRMLRDIFFFAGKMLTSRREGRGPPGLVDSTVLRKIDRIGYDLMPAWVRHHGMDAGLTDLNPDVLRRSLLKLNPVNARQAVSACRDLFRTVYLEVKDERAKALYDTVGSWRESFTVKHVGADEYADAWRNADESECTDVGNIRLCDALTLLYRTGIRPEELWQVRAVLRGKSHDGSWELLLDHNPKDRLKTFESRRRIPVDVLVPERELSFDLLSTLASGLSQAERADRGRHFEQLAESLKRIAWDGAESPWSYRHAFASNLLAVLQWPDDTDLTLGSHVDPVFMDRRQDLRRQLLPRNTAGAHTLYAVAMLMGHTTPGRTRFSYAHNLEVLLAAHVVRKANADEYWMPSEWPLAKSSDQICSATNWMRIARQS